MLYPALITLSVLASTLAQDPSRRPAPSAPEGPARQFLYPSGPPQHQFAQDLPYNINLLEPQFQYPGGFNYVPEKQPYPRAQPPIVFYAGAAPPGQQFLYRPGSPPGNFLIPQPQPQPQPQPGVFYGANPQGPGVFVAGYPKPAHIPPIEKDAEEIPNLAGNHPVTGRPVLRPTERRPEKLETLDEPVPAGEADVLAEADKNFGGFPKKSTPTIPALKPGQRFFILNGHPLFSNFPLEGVNQPNLPPTLQHPNPGIYVYRQQPQYINELHPQQFEHQVPIQDLFLRNAVTGQIADVKPAPLPAQFTDGNFISLNQPNDFRQNFLFRNVIPIAPPQAAQQQQLPVLLKGAKPESSAKSEQLQSRLGKEIELLQQTPILQPADPLASIFGGDVYAVNDYYRYSDLANGKEEDDSVVIDAKVQDDDKEGAGVVVNRPNKSEEPSLSQAQPAAIALAGVGGVASAGPRATALAGINGLAIARPQATAVAGPRSEEPENKTKPKPKKPQQ